MKKKIMNFRSWDGFNSKMRFWTMNDLCTWGDKDEKPSALEVWMQSIGLFDKNNKEIYEGDIIKTKDFTGFVWYRCPDFVIRQDLGRTEWTYVDFFRELEIIGNIYEKN